MKQMKLNKIKFDDIDFSNQDDKIRFDKFQKQINGQLLFNNLLKFAFFALVFIQLFIPFIWFVFYGIERIVSSGYSICLCGLLIFTFLDCLYFKEILGEFDSDFLYFHTSLNTIESIKLIFLFGIVFWINRGKSLFPLTITVFIELVLWRISYLNEISYCQLWQIQKNQHFVINTICGYVCFILFIYKLISNKIGIFQACLLYAYDFVVLISIFPVRNKVPVSFQLKLVWVDRLLSTGYLSYATAPLVIFFINYICPNFLGLKSLEKYILVLGVSLCFIMLFFADEQNRRNVNLSGSYYKNLLVPFLIIIVCLLAINNHFLQSNAGKSDIQTSVLPIAIAVFCSNISAILILMQLNYGKYNSNYLVRKIISLDVLLFPVVFPGFVIFLNVFFDLSAIFDNSVEIITTSILFVLISPFYLFFVLQRNLQPSFLLMSILSEIKEKDIRAYAYSDRMEIESKIDSCLLIVKTIIKSSDTVQANGCFEILANWINKNIKGINERTGKSALARMNRFYDLFSVIIKELLLSKNYILNKYWLQSIQKYVMHNINTRNFTDYRIVFQILSKYLESVLQQKEDDFPEKKQLFNDVLLVHSFFIPTLLNNFTPSLEEYNSRETINFDFKMYLVEPIINIYERLTENNQVDYINNFDIIGCFFDVYTPQETIYHGCIIYKESEQLAKWNYNQANLYTELWRGIVSASSCKQADKSCFRSILRNIDHLGTLLLTQDYEDSAIRKFWNFYFNTILEIYNKAIIAGVEITQWNIDKIYEPLWQDIPMEVWDSYYNIFVKLLDYLFSMISESSKSLEEQKQKIEYERGYGLWSRFDQLKEIVKRHSKYKCIRLNTIQEGEVVFKKKYPWLGGAETYFKNMKFVNISNMDFTKKDFI